jgi:hypothetical protein
MTAPREHPRPVHHIYNDAELLRRLKETSGFGAFLALRHFKKLLTERERELLVSARNGGLTWDTMASLLSVTPQAVYQRYHRLVAEEIDEPAFNVDDPDPGLTPRADRPLPDPNRIA